MSNLQEIRRKKGFTQQQLAEYCKISIAAVQEYEQNINCIDTCHLDTLLRMSEILNVCLLDLFEDEKLSRSVVAAVVRPTVQGAEH